MVESLRLIARRANCILSSCRIPYSRCYHEGMSTNRRPEPAEADSLMDIGIRNIFTEEYDMVRTNARRFFKEFVKPNEKEWEKRGYPDPQVYREAGELGLLGLSCPEEDHGMGGDTLMASIMWDEGSYANSAAAGGMIVHSDVVLPYLSAYGTNEQKEKYIPKMISGEWIGAIAMTEPGAGSDLQGVMTTGKKDGDDWILNGSKCFITNGYNCGFVVVVCRTDTKVKQAHKGLSLIIVEDGTPGFTKAKPSRKLGLHSSDTSELYFEDVRVPAENVIGDVNGGFYHLMQKLPIERLSAGVLAIAWAEFMFEETKQHLQQRQAFGRTLADLQTIQHKMAERRRRYVQEELLLTKH